MTNEITIAAPSWSQPLAMAVRDVLNPHAATVGFAVSAVVKDEARRCLPHYEAACRPATNAQVREWLLAINAGVRNPLSRDDFNARCAAIADVCHDLPASAFTAETRREAMQSPEFAFFPSAADAYKFLSNASAGIRKDRLALRRLATADVAVPVAQPSAEDRAKVAAQMAGLSAGIEQRSTPAIPAFARKTLDPEHLAALRAANPLVQGAIAMRAERMARSS